ncbi:hypothetical protein BDZ91DRAFT_852964 [Kalaharituber pfeilii]|nr:hypothetical protein BDZ91DRAFT_852964 [Kalaharituber pfeilii]
MQPLGTLPSAKILPKQHGGKKGAGKGPMMNGNAKGTHLQSVRESNGMKMLDIAVGTSTLKVEAPTLTPPSPTVELRKFTFPDAPEEFPSTKTEVGRQKLSAVVQAAVDRSARVGMEVLGKAIQRLYEDSMENPELGELLDAVLAQKATPEQTVAFQAHIRTAREKLEKQSAQSDSNGINPAAITAVPVTPKNTPTLTSSNRKLVVPEPVRGRKGRRTSRRLQENQEATPQPDATSELSGLSPDSNTENPPFHGGPSEPCSPPATVTQNQDKAKQVANTNSEPTQAELDLRYEQVKAELRKKMPSEDIAVGESAIRFIDDDNDDDDDDDALVATGTAGVGVSTRASAKKETPISRKRPRSPDPPSTPPPAEATNGTPPALEHPEIGAPPKKKRQTRVKTSPVKNKTGSFVLAGLGNPTADPGVRGARYASEAVSENDDLCCVCNGPGKFLCCDRCPKSFHFTCINPPVDENNIPEDSWYCNKCSTQMNPPVKQPRGLFGPLLEDIERRNPISFSLPEHIKTYFQGVQSGTNGEYMELQDNKPTRRGGFVEELDHYRTKDKNGNPIFCYKCELSSLGQKKIVACDFCPLYWHLDCLNPPLANPPSQLRKWMCPAHAEQGLLQPRRPRNAKVVDTYLRRGHKNNGYIEIENSESEEEMQFTEHEDGGIIYRLPERGIKLDFIDKIKAEHARGHLFDNSADTSKRRRLITSNGDSTVPASREQSFVDEDTITEPSIVDRSSDESELVHTLLMLSQKGGAGLKVFQNADDLSSLINALLAEAPTSVQALLRSSSGTNTALAHHASAPQIPTEQPPFSPADSTDSAATVPELERKQLQALLELCQKRIAMLDARERHPER